MRAVKPSLPKRNAARPQNTVKPPKLDVAKALECKCAFCDATKDLLICDWPSRRWMLTSIAALAPGDQVYRGKIRSRLLRSHQGVVRESGLHPQWGFWQVRGEFGDGRSMLIYGTVRKRVLAMMPAPCDAWCCPLHRVERGEGISSGVYCRNHWMAWQEVA
jgi:hypothetical protein